MNVTHGLRRARCRSTAAGSPRSSATGSGPGRRRATVLPVSPVLCVRGGIGADDRVAVLMLKQDRDLELYLAVAWAGAVVVPVNIRWSPAEIEDSLRDCRPVLLIVDNAFAKDTTSHLAEAIEEMRKTAGEGHRVQQARERVVARQAILKLQKIPKQHLPVTREVGKVDAALRAVDRAHQRYRQHLQKLVPRRVARPWIRQRRKSSHPAIPSTPPTPGVDT